ncbi:Ubiquitin-conjugating enzyme E2 J2 [Porphyridium purpureum]|uniref:Ubiquitin-conjugating enzyme E2 J2 n=1 Tax=Porphyridium purpureum TaxID=35688 RepID=A0A5J4Z0Z1_PORPP|nr:Ubiquitin-conjugating enzyme E2 J2 [Porphyridium purpureum]|eukprot:POR1563..scf208_2
MAAASQTALQRLRKEYRNIMRDPPPCITARPHPSNILRWYFVIEGPEDTPYQHGLYMGKLVFPDSYPYKPPAVYMLTPSGRFKPNTKLCLSMSDFHPEEWNAIWGVGSVLTGLLSFMVGNEDTVGSMRSTDAEKRKYATASHDWNEKDKMFAELFPELLRSERTSPASADARGTPQAGAGVSKAHSRAGNNGTDAPARQGGPNHKTRAAGSGSESSENQPEKQSESLVSLFGWMVVLVSVLAVLWKVMQHMTL